MIYKSSIKLFAIVNTCLLILAGVWVFNNPTADPGSLLLRGDFPAFYAAGILVNESPDELYNPEIQAKVQNRYWSSEKKEYLYYAYPPQLAFTFSLLSKFSPRIAHIIWVLIQISALGLTLYLLNNALICKSLNWFWDLLLSLALLPLVVAVLSGQNSAITILILTVSLILSSESSTRRQFLAGIILGVLAFKPHFMILASGVIVIARGRFVLWGVLLSSILQIIAVSFMLGSVWVTDWLAGVRFFNFQESQANADSLISLLNLYDLSIGVIFGEKIADIFWLREIIYLVVVFSAVILLGGYLRKANLEKYLHLGLCLLPIVLVFLSPHTMYYDLSVLVPTLFCIFKLGDGSKYYVLSVVSLMIVNILTAYKPPAFGASMASITIVMLLILLHGRKTCSLDK